MQYHAIQCNTMQYNAITCNTMQYHAIPCNTMQYHAILCNTMQYYAILCNTMPHNTMPYQDRPCNAMLYNAMPHHTTYKPNHADAPGHSHGSGRHAHKAHATLKHGVEKYMESILWTVWCSKVCFSMQYCI